MMKRTNKWDKLARWLALMLCVSAFCMPMMGLTTHGGVTAEAVEVVPAEPVQEVAATEPESPPSVAPEGEVKPTTPEQCAPEPQAQERENPIPDPVPELQDAAEPPAIAPEPDSHTPSDADGEPAPTPEPAPAQEPMYEPTQEPTSDPPTEPEPTPVVTDAPTPMPEPTPIPIATCPPTTPPAPDALYNVLVDAPIIWMKEPAKITIRIEDVNGVGWGSVTAQVVLPKATQDISAALSASGIVTAEINDNCTVTVLITDTSGSPHEFTRQVVCFDRTAPEVKAKLDGRVLRMKATDDLSGVAYLYVNNQRFDTLGDGGALDVALKDLDDYKEYKQFRVRCVDWAGNESKEIKLKNPLYKSGSSGSSGGSNGGGAAPVYPAQPTPPAATVTPEPTDVPETPVASPTPIPLPTPTPEPNPFSVDGTGTVLNYAGSSDGKEFFIITTPDGSTFYLVIERQRGTENVYFLDAATERDLLSLAEASGQVMPTPEPTPMPEPTPVPTPEPVPEPPPEKGNSSMIFIVIFVALAAGGAGYYFKIMKPRQQQDIAEYDEADDPDDEPDVLDYDDEDDEP